MIQRMNDSERKRSWREDSNFLRLKLWVEDQNAFPSRTSQVPTQGGLGLRGGAGRMSHGHPGRWLFMG